MKREAVQVGQHHLWVEDGYIGGPGSEWEVGSPTELNDSLACPRLAITRDSAEQITIAVCVLQTPRIYRLVSN